MEGVPTLRLVRLRGFGILVESNRRGCPSARAFGADDAHGGAAIRGEPAPTRRGIRGWFARRVYGRGRGAIDPASRQGNELQQLSRCRRRVRVRVRLPDERSDVRHRQAHQPVRHRERERRQWRFARSLPHGGSRRSDLRVRWHRRLQLYGRCGHGARNSRVPLSHRRRDAHVL